MQRARLEPWTTWSRVRGFYHSAILSSPREKREKVQFCCRSWVYLFLLFSFHGLYIVILWYRNGCVVLVFCCLQLSIFLHKIFNHFVVTFWSLFLVYWSIKINSAICLWWRFRFISSMCYFLHHKIPTWQSFTTLGDRSLNMAAPKINDGMISSLYYKYIFSKIVLKALKDTFCFSRHFLANLVWLNVI